MADNVQLPVTGTGTADVVQATDDVSGVQYPIVKLADGTANSTAKIGGDATNGLDVDVTRMQAWAQSTASTASWTSATADETTLSIATAGYATVSLLIKLINTLFTDGIIYFESSNDGGTTWFLHGGQDTSGSDAFTAATGLHNGFAGLAVLDYRDLVAHYDDGNTVQQLRFNVAGMTNFRVRLETPIAGTGTLDLRLVADTAPVVLPSSPVNSLYHTPVSGCAPAGSAPQDDPVLVGGQDGSAVRVLKTDASGELQIDVLTIAAGDNNIGNVDIVTMPDATVVGKAADGAAVAGNPVLVAGQDGTNAQSLKTDANGELQVDVLTLPSLGDVTVIGKAADGAAVAGNPVLVAGQDGTNAQSLKTDTTGRLEVVATTATVGGTVAVAGTVAHDGNTANNPVNGGGRAIAHGTNPTAVAAADVTDWYFNRAGVPFVIGGHPNIISIEIASTTAVTDAAIITVSAGTKIVVTQAQLIADNANTAFPQARLGFGTAAVPTTTGVVLTHPGIPAGGGVSRGDGSGIIATGGDGEDLRWTAGAPTGGSLRALVSYYTIES